MGNRIDLVGRDVVCTRWGSQWRPEDGEVDVVVLREAGDKAVVCLHDELDADAEDPPHLFMLPLSAATRSGPSVAAQGRYGFDGYKAALGQARTGFPFGIGLHQVVARVSGAADGEPRLVFTLLGFAEPQDQQVLQKLANSPAVAELLQGAIAG